MKKITTKILAVAMILVMALALMACDHVGAEGKWVEATYRSDRSFGNGKTTIEVEVVVEEQSVTFTVKTDKENLEDALLEHDLIDGDASQYGMYIKYVNGIRADYEKDGAWWNICKDGVALMTGASGESIGDGNHYEFVYTPA